MSKCGSAPSPATRYAIRRAATCAAGRVARYAALRAWASVFIACAVFVAAVPPVRAGNGGPAAGYAASLTATHYRAVVGEPVEVLMDLTPTVPPPGYFATSLVTVLEAPPGPPPKVVEGFPKATIIAAVPGRYRFLVRVNLITKSSCGGVEADTILESRITVDAMPGP